MISSRCSEITTCGAEWRFQVFLGVSSREWWRCLDFYAVNATLQIWSHLGKGETIDNSVAAEVPNDHEKGILWPWTGNNRLPTKAWSAIPAVACCSSAKVTCTRAWGRFLRLFFNDFMILISVTGKNSERQQYYQNEVSTNILGNSETTSLAKSGSFSFTASSRSCCSWVSILSISCSA